MGLLDRLFKKDPDKILSRAEQMLAVGDPVEALDLARRLETDDSPRHREAARKVIDAARGQLLASTLERADQAEADGHLGDAVDWLQSAVGYASDDAVRAQLQERLGTLQRRAAAEEMADLGGDRVALPAARAAANEADADADPDRYARDDDDHDDYFEDDPYEGDPFATLIGMLEESVALRYETQPPEFRLAYLTLNEGEAAAALEPLERLVEERPEDPVRRFERGRCRLLLGEAAGAREDFEAAWKELGDAHLDLARSLSVPALWAEACLAAEEPQPVLDRLEDLARVERGDAELSYRYALALIQADRLEEARSFLGEAAQRHAGQPVFSHHLAVVLDNLGQRRLAIDCLETAIAPSCATGSCNRPPRYLPSLRKLADLYLADGKKPERARQLVALVAEDQKGQLQAPDLRLLARYYEQTGRAEAAAEATTQAEALAGQGEEAAVGLEILTGYRPGQSQGHRPI